MPVFHHDGLDFYYQETGTGIPFIFQHGLGGDVSQPFGVFQPTAGFRLIALDCRAHGRTAPVGDEGKVAILAFVDDVASLMDFLSISRAVIGGISMGAAVALEFALRYPARVMGLVLSRPAWLDRPYPAEGNVFLEVAKAIRAHGAERGAAVFARTEIYARCLRQSPDNAASLLRQFSAPRATETVAKLERIPRYAPSYHLEDLARMAVPALVLASRQDAIHPFEYGRTLAESIPGAEFRELVPKSVDAAAHAASVQNHLESFLTRQFPIDAAEGQNRLDFSEPTSKLSR